MFRLPLGERADPLAERRAARQGSVASLLAFCALCAAIRLAPIVLEHSGF